jgi:hypothetical protein
VSIAIDRVQYGGDGSNMGHVEVVFIDSREPDTEVVVTVERRFAKPDRPGAAPWQTQVVGVSFRDRAEPGLWAGPALRAAWVRRFPLERVIDEAREAARQYEVDEFDPAPRLPPGAPRRATRREWYRALLRVVRFHEAREMAPMDVYRMVAARKGVEVNHVKQWVFQARRLEEEGS